MNCASECHRSFRESQRPQEAWRFCSCGYLRGGTGEANAPHEVVRSVVAATLWVGVPHLAQMCKLELIEEVSPSPSDMAQRCAELRLGPPPLDSDIGILSHCSVFFFPQTIKSIHL